MTAYMRDRHQPGNEITETKLGDDKTQLKCECGWDYTADDQFKIAVVKRHIQEGRL